MEEFSAGEEIRQEISENRKPETAAKISATKSEVFEVASSLPVER